MQCGGKIVFPSGYTEQGRRRLKSNYLTLRQILFRFSSLALSTYTAYHHSKMASICVMRLLILFVSFSLVVVDLESFLYYVVIYLSCFLSGENCLKNNPLALLKLVTAAEIIWIFFSVNRFSLKFIRSGLNRQNLLRFCIMLL